MQMNYFALRMEGIRFIMCLIITDIWKFEGKDIYVTRTPIDKSGGSAWDYLQKLAAETGLQTEEAENILSKQYELVDVKRDNVPLAQYLGDKTQLTVLRTPKQIYYPFGCNVSQRKR